MYISNGQCRTRTVNGKTTIYHHSNSILLSKQTGDETLRYFYARNLQGDITAVYRNSDSSRKRVRFYGIWRARLLFSDGVIRR